jgi:cobalamin biosynthesis protein CobT
MRLLTRREAGKLLIVLSDGHPQAMGSTDEQASHLKRVVKNIVASKKIKLFGVGINDESVQRFYPDYVVLRDINKLAETMMHQLKRLIFS